MDRDNKDMAMQLQSNEERDAAFEKERARIEAEQNKIKQEAALKKMEANFAAKKAELARQVAEFEMTENSLAGMMMTMLDVVIQMEGVIKMVKGVNVAFSCISEAISCMDVMLDLNKMMFDGSMTHNYGFFARLKRKREMKRAISNNVNRVRQVCDTIRANLDMATEASVAFGRLSEKVNAMMGKKLNRPKKKSKKTSAVTRVEGSAAARALVDSYKQNSPEESKPSGSGAPKGDDSDSDIIFP